VTYFDPTGFDPAGFDIGPPTPEPPIPPVVLPVETYAGVLAGSHTPVVRALFLSDLDTVLHEVPGKLLGGSVTSDRLRDQRRSGSVAILNETGLYTPGGADDYVTPFRMMALERGALVNGVPTYTRLMTGLLDEPATSLGSGTVTFSVWSRFRIADRQFANPITFTRATRIKDVIRTVAELAGLGTDDDWYVLSDGGRVLEADRSYDVADNMLRSMTELAFNNGLMFYDDPQGRAVLRPYLCQNPDCSDNIPHPAYLDVVLGTNEPVWAFDTPISDQRRITGAQPVNRQDVAGVGPDQYPIRGTWRDLNPASPTYNPVDGSGPLGDLPGVPYTSPEIRLQGQANEVALQLGYERNLATEEGTEQVIPIPFVYAGDVVALGDTVVLVDQVTCPLDLGLMSLTWRRTRSLQ
jgi:hypothetical protein